jgi:hypothetical protein
MLFSPQPKTGKERMALVKSRRWDIAYQLRVRVFDGDVAVQTKVRKLASQWLSHAKSSGGMTRHCSSKPRLPTLPPS